ncbi:Integrase, catalytic region [Candidatus Koribacter versatilis Ellin345]|uniref:Integrase, catalytic region n=1 Tax=Koribacter versatilis (strain Ellin345) TaxID=204669 RepID=Q1IL60_KORVE|nr:Mu transposase C-terminal domain-containing protein [Candidatus Koribacter versatilis]ABF42390.1 Integrase, catalytic region [Candidatus Koribacter versatilis Ellin345]
MSDLWLIEADVLAAISFSERHLRRLAREGKVISRASATKAANGRFVREYCIESFPTDLRERLLAVRGAITLLPQNSATAAEQPLLKIACVDEEEEAQAARREAACLAIANFEQHKAQWATVRLADGEPVTSISRLVEHLAAKYSSSPATIWRWHSRFKKGERLADRTREDKGRSRWFARHGDAAAAAAYIGLKWGAREAHRSLLSHHELLGIAKEEMPSYETVRSFLNSAPPAMSILVRDGERRYRDLISPYVRRGYNEYANQIWVSDHMIHDLFAQNDVFDDIPRGQRIRMRLTALLDFRARYVVGYSFAEEGSSISITTCLRQAIASYGACEEFYCDNGKDYKSVAKAALPAYLRDSGKAPQDWWQQELDTQAGVLARCGISIRHCIVRHPQSKHVERFFRTVHKQFDALFPTYSGSNPDRRPEFTSKAIAEHSRLERESARLIQMGKGINGLHQSLLPPATLVMKLFRAWLDEYHNTPHGGQGMDGRTPAQVFEQERNPLQRPAPADNVLALMLCSREQRMVRECSVTVGKRRFIGADFTAVKRLHDVSNCEVMVAYDPLDLDRVAVLDLDGNLICWAKPEEFLPQNTTQAANAIAESMQQRRRLERNTRDAYVAMRDAARASGVVTGVERLVNKVLALPPASEVPAVQRSSMARAAKAAAAAAPKVSQKYVGDVAEEIAGLMEGD